MKNHIITLLLSFFSASCFSQSGGYEYKGRQTPSVTKEKLGQARLVDDIVPGLWSKLGLPSKYRDELEQRRRMNFPLGYYLYPQGGYDIVTDYVSVEIRVSGNGRTTAAESPGNVLTPAQKNILNSAAGGSDVYIKIRFRYRNRTTMPAEPNDRIVEGGLTVTVVPETEACFPGGNKELTGYLTVNIFNKIKDKKMLERISRAVVTFTVKEDGRIANAYLSGSSGNAGADKLILDAINAMPAWAPAKNAKGMRVREEFSIPLGAGGC